VGFSTFVDDEQVASLGEEPDQCFLCGGRLGRGEYIVFWHGYGRNLFLHQGCAKKLGCCLISDALLARQITKAPHRSRLMLRPRASGEL
jgi:hypothetical protein